MNKLTFKWIKKTSIMVSVFLLWQACEPSYIPASHFLIKDEPENFGYGLYSYMLFSPQNTDSLKYSTLLSTFLSKRNELVEISKYKVDSNMNIIYLPVNKNLPDDFEEFSNERQVRWVLKNYNFIRADKILKQFQFERTSGPYIISFHQPVLVIRHPVSESYLIQDFAKVPPSVAAMWLDEFIKLSYMNDYRNGVNLNIFGDSLKAAVGNAAKKDPVNKSMLALEENIKEWITFRERKK